MIHLRDLSVGDVSGMIAAAILVFKFLIPAALPVILLGILRFRKSEVTASAVSWSVIGRYLHSSYWPTILQTDSTATRGVSRSVVFVSRLGNFAAALLGIAAIVTPLGLYEAVVPDGSPTQQPFHYVRDGSPVGLGTPPRTNSSWSRICGYFIPAACPHSHSNVTTWKNATGTYSEGDSYDSHIPQEVIDVFQSGLATMSKTVSSIFDIQYRSYTKAQINDSPRAIRVDNLTAYTVGSYRPITTLLLSQNIVLVEGLIVDMRNGGIGFRNHTAPTWRPYGSTWIEDILFIEPETECVNTNLTLDFTIPLKERESTNPIANLVLTDRGGFVNINRTYPTWNRENVQDRPELRLRAYKAAWLNNALSMAWMNVTNVKNESDPRSHAFQYLNSYVGKPFTLHYNDSSTASRMSIRASALTTNTAFGYFLEGTDSGISNISSTGRNYSFPSKPPLYSNPFHINSYNFTTASLVCAGAGGSDYANISNIAALCGLLYGAPQRQDGSASLLFDPGSSWSIPIYSCMSAIKATIKTVSFHFNGTDDLSGLAVTNIADKEYASNHSKPLWAVENTNNFLADVTPLWGVVTPDSAKRLNVSTIRKESLYLPGYSSMSGSVLVDVQNLPGVDFHSGALAAAYAIDSYLATSPVDYSGASNLAMYRLWQELSRNPTNASQILNLVWTDIAANLVLGTKSLESSVNIATKRDEKSSDNQDTPLVTTYERRVKFHLVNGIPAFLVLTLGGLVFATMLAFVIFGLARTEHMRIYLNETSAGRLLSSQLVSDTEEPLAHISKEAWINDVGMQRFTLPKNGAPTGVESRITMLS